MLWNSCNKQRQSYKLEYFFIREETTWNRMAKFVRLSSDQKLDNWKSKGGDVPK